MSSVVASLENVTAKVDAGDRLTDADVEALGASRDIIGLGMLAMTVRRRLHGTAVTYLRVADLEFDANGRVTGASPAAAGEVRILHTPATLDRALEVVSRAREAAGEAALSAFSLHELSQMGEGLPVVLSALKKAGLEMIALASIDRLSAPEQAVEAIADAGLVLSRLTVAETPARPWTAVCREVSGLQTRLQSLRAFAPLPRTIDESQPTTGYEDVKRIALARVLVENVPTIQVDWALYGPKLAQVALTFGADDLDSVSPVDSESEGRRRSTLEEIRRSIRAAGFEPVERDARFARRD